MQTAKNMTMTAWNVYVPGDYDTDRLIDTVFFNPECDEHYVRHSLIEHNGYPNNIVIMQE